MLNFGALVFSFTEAFSDIIGHHLSVKPIFDATATSGSAVSDRTPTFLLFASREGFSLFLWCTCVSVLKQWLDFVVNCVSCSAVAPSHHICEMNVTRSLI